jgi:hypothetical protein
MIFVDDGDDSNRNYCIIEEHDMEILEGLEGVEGVEGIEGVEELDKLDNIVLVDTVDTVDDTGVGVFGVFGVFDSLDELREVEICEALDFGGCDTQETEQKREINRKSVGEMKNEKSVKIREITIEMREVEMSINTSTVEEVIFKKHRVEIIDKSSRGCIIQGVITGYTLVGRVYDPDIVLEFEDGRSFYNDNFGYLMRFYI